MRFAYPRGFAVKVGPHLVICGGRLALAGGLTPSGIFHSMTCLHFPALNTNVAISVPWLHLEEAR